MKVIYQGLVECATQVVEEFDLYGQTLQTNEQGEYGLYSCVGDIKVYLDLQKETWTGRHEGDVSDIRDDLKKDINFPISDKFLCIELNGNKTLDDFITALALVIDSVDNQVVDTATTIKKAIYAFERSSG